MVSGGRLIRRFVGPALLIFMAFSGRALATPPAFVFMSGASGRVTDPTGGKISIWWSANTEVNMSKYILYRSTNAGVVVGSSWTVSTATLTWVINAGTTHQDVALTNGTTYFYKLQAVNTLGEATTSFNEVSAVARTNAVPAQPSLLNPPDGSTVTATTLGLQMTGSDPDGDGLAYRVYFSTVSGSTSPATGIAYSSGSLSFTTYYLNLTNPFFFYEIQSSSVATLNNTILTGVYLNSSTTYYWTVGASDGVLDAPLSATRSFYFRPAPTITTAYAVTAAVTTLSNASSTQIYIFGTYLSPIISVKLTDAAGTVLTSPVVTTMIPGLSEYIIATIPAGVAPGTYGITVVTPAGSVTSANILTFTQPTTAIVAGSTVAVIGAGAQVFSIGGATFSVTFSGLPQVSMSFSTAGVFNMGGLNFTAMTTSATITIPGLGITIPPNLFPGVTNATMKVSTNPALSPINPQVPTIMAAANQMQSQGNAQQAMPQPIDGGQREISWFDDTGNALAEAAQKGIAEIKIFYPDANNDKRIDGTKGFQTRGTGPQAVAMRNIFGHDFPPEDVEADDTHMIGCYLKGTGKLGQWSDPFPTKVDTVNKCMVFKTQHFSVFTLMAAAPAVNLDGLMVYPNPYNPTSATISDIDPAINGTLKFQGMTADATIRVFNLTGDLIVEMGPGYAVGKAVSPGAGRAEWDGLNTDGESVARGLYFYIVDSATGRKRGKIAVLK